MAAITSGISSVSIGEGKDKKTIYTATKTTPTKDKDGNKTYKVEIVQYDNEKGDGGRVIGEKKNGKINLITDGDIRRNSNNLYKLPTKIFKINLLTNKGSIALFIN